MVGQAAEGAAMSWLLDLVIGQFIPNFWPWILGAIGGAVLFLTGRAGGAAKVRRKQAEAALEATVKGQEAARKGRAEASEKLAKGATPQQVKEGNDAKW
jgi:hypothetical protein